MVVDMAAGPPIPLLVEPMVPFAAVTSNQETDTAVCMTMMIPKSKKDLAMS